MFSTVLRLVVIMMLLSTVSACLGLKPVVAPQSAASRASASTPAAVSSASAPAATAAPTPEPVVIYSQPPKAGGGLIPSSWQEPQGNPGDRVVWENVGFENAQAISEVRWRGGYDPAKGGSGGPVVNFTVGIYQSIPAGSEPDLAIAPLVHYQVRGNAEETPAEVIGGVQLYDVSLCPARPL